MSVCNYTALLSQNKSHIISSFLPGRRSFSSSMEALLGNAKQPPPLSPASVSGEKMFSEG